MREPKQTQVSWHISSAALFIVTHSNHFSEFLVSVIKTSLIYYWCTDMQSMAHLIIPSCIV